MEILLVGWVLFTQIKIEICREKLLIGAFDYFIKNEHFYSLLLFKLL